MSLEVGQVFAGYTILRELGVGGMGAVFRAWHVHMRKFVALKLLHPNTENLRFTLTTNEVDLKSLRIEALTHPGLVRGGPGRATNGNFALSNVQVLAAPKSINPHTKFEAEVYVLTKEEGGRHTPFFKGYRPQFYFRTTDVTGAVELPAGTEMVMPGDNIKIVVELIAPIAMEQGLRFAIREGGKTVGAGVVSKILT